MPSTITVYFFIFIDVLLASMSDKNPEGKLAITKVILRPVVQFADNRAPSHQQFDVLHQKAHQRCFIANSVKTDIHIDAQLGQ